MYGVFRDKHLVAFLEDTVSLPTVPSVAEYWNMGETTIRLDTSVPRRVIGANSLLVMFFQVSNSEGVVEFTNPL